MNHHPAASVVGFVSSIGLALLAQVSEIIQAVDGEADPNTWGLKLVTVAAILAAAYCAKLALARPSAEAQARVETQLQEERGENRRLTTDLTVALSKVAALEAARETRIQLEGRGQAAPPASPGSP